MITIAVDCMGGDHGPGVTLPACRHFIDKHPDVSLLLVGLPQALAEFFHARARVVSASEVVAMDDPLEVALRRKKDSSMRVAIQQVKDGSAHAAVSAGNTAALMAIARYVLKTLDGIDRPAIAAQVPNAKGGGTTMLDLGANVDCSAEHLLKFAVMGSAFVSVLTQNDSPTVGLLNIGEEAIKGSETIKKAGELLRAAGAAGDLNFFGNVEGNDIFKGTVDLVVCDGFVGNVMLKSSEGVTDDVVVDQRNVAEAEKLADISLLRWSGLSERPQHHVLHRVQPWSVYPAPGFLGHETGVIAPEEDQGDGSCGKGRAKQGPEYWAGGPGGRA